MPQKFTLLVIVVALLANLVLCGPLPKKTEPTTSAGDHHSSKNPAGGGAKDVTEGSGEATTQAKASANHKDDAPEAESVRDGTSHKNADRAVDEENGETLEDLEDNKLSSKEEALLDEKLQLEAEAVRDIKSQNDADAAEDEENDESLKDLEEDEDDAELPEAEAVRDETSLENADSELPEAEAVRDETSLNDAHAALDDEDDTELPEAEAVRDGTSIDESSIDDADAALDDEDDTELLEAEAVRDGSSIDDDDAALDDEDGETLEDLEDGKVAMEKESQVQPEAESVKEGSYIMPKKLLIEDDDEEEGENLEDLEDPEGDKEDSPGGKRLDAGAVQDEDWMNQDDYADRSNKPLQKILPKRAVGNILKHLRRSALHRQMSEKYFVRIARVLVNNGFIVEAAKETEPDYS